MDYVFTNEWLEKAAKELNETPDRKKEEIEKLKILIQAEKQLYFNINDTENLMKFLRVSKFDSKKAFERIRRYFKNVKTYSDDWEELGLSETVINGIKTDVGSILPKRARDGSKILYVNCRNWNISLISADTLFRLMWMALELMIDQEQETQIAGISVVYDVRGLTYQHYVQLTPMYLYKSVQMFAGTVPYRLKSINVVHSSKISSYIYATAKHLLPQKIRNRVYFYDSDLAELYERMGRICLPVEIGGEQKLQPNEELLEIYRLFEQKSIKSAKKYGYVKPNKLTAKGRTRYTRKLT